MGGLFFYIDKNCNWEQTPGVNRDTACEFSLNPSLKKGKKNTPFTLDIGLRRYGL
jgi:hypothetical protein